jgi:hypothetical protein
MASMKAITIKLPARTLAQLREEARASGRSVADLVRERLEASTARPAASVHALTSDLAGTLTGGRRSASNERRRFRRT